MKADFFRTQKEHVETHKQALLDSYKYIKRVIDANLDFSELDAECNTDVSYEALQFINKKVLVSQKDLKLKTDDLFWVEYSIIVKSDDVIIAFYENSIVAIMDPKNVTYE